MAARTIITGFDPLGSIAEMLVPHELLHRQAQTRFIQRWSMTAYQYLMLMQQPSRPWKQRGIIIATPIFASAAGGSVVITNEGISYTNFGNLVAAGIAFQLDGSLDDIGPGFLDRTQIHSGEWWTLEPEAGIGNSYDVRNTNANPFDVAAAAQNVWIQISEERQWRIQVTAHESPATQSATMSAEIRDTGSGSALDTANFALDVEN